MRIVHIVWELGTGGVETMLVDVVNEQIKSETVAIAVVNQRIEESLVGQIDNRCVIKLCNRKRGSRSLLPWIRLNTFLLTWRPDIIHFHLEGMRKLVFYPAPKVFTIHNIHTSGQEYSSYKALFAISEGVRRYTERQGYNAITVWNGIDSKAIFIKKGNYYKKDSFCKIVCVGRLYTPHKGQDILIESLSLLKRQGIDNFHLYLIGEGESRNQIESLIERYAMKDKVTMMGQRDRKYIYQHLCDYDLFVLPSRSEGFGLSVAEAMCAKVPVIVCDLESTKDVVDYGRYGRLFETGNKDSLAKQIEDFLCSDVDTDLIEKALTFARDNFDIKNTASRYIEEYKKVLYET